jgi:isopenicillin N synthase-like dioxygenase
VTAPVLTATNLEPGAVDDALLGWGAFSLDTNGTGLPWRDVLDAAHAFFALPRAAKAELAIERSSHFRGWSEMHNERDWREQLHLGRERPAAGLSPPYLRLEGPNFWPEAPTWRAPVLGYMTASTDLGVRILGSLGHTLGLAEDAFAGVSGDGYVVMKLIGYHPQASSSEPARPGVASHVDFSWLTFTLQDAPGLEVRSRDGAWTLIEPRPGHVWVHPGELLELATGGRYVAAPHRVVNRSSSRTRVSIPLFVNPPLAAAVPIWPSVATVPARRESATLAGEHVHRVLLPGAPRVGLHFGESEWRRKGLNGWCATCAPALQTATAP